MPKILSVQTTNLPHKLEQEQTLEFARGLFRRSFKDIERLLKVFHNGEIKTRYFAKPIEWFAEPHSLQEKNDSYIESATRFGGRAIRKCLQESPFLNRPIDYHEIDAIFFISSSGLATPSIEARIMNKLPFSPHTKRIPIWGLGCAGGASGFSRAYEYCKAFPDANVLVLSVELCSLTFQHDDQSKSNLVGTSLFSDGVGCALLCGDESEARSASSLDAVPEVRDTMSTLMPNSEEVMGWDVKDNGLYVVFSRDIPNIIRGWLKPNVDQFLERNALTGRDIRHFIAHPGGKKVLDAYVDALDMPLEKTDVSKAVLQEFGNMSSATVFYVMERFMARMPERGDTGLMAALGPGFSSELLYIQWR
ncbi:3-oxoacyl-[acyl-carrier-protein] synthase III C-terminal domain-containing protein [Fictibacillus enclensis]|jgi:alkylresorcinol/alkylpyrone synthase|uniref:type III polyketide synthase n=1 Tax=Fictibacillus enclensis TaxID=1017270 RepID=UPI0025A16A28|nr:3-oxoacyl-[acyl-carrier-protein] synthase III C-terminal domain-containing protein [Fictibacillus enclensis]MDM5199571.1 3-oxoacyl-[acyl-carrier-protein] synthase III C-terminal domain-containing protein [Fictibacillus enclensis]MDM5338809.1 3-oxoacyl-[acyl-carrier-protein] synthase III C-terminal domain-containing protein [Fictibacillus enclensis]